MFPGSIILYSVQYFLMGFQKIRAEFCVLSSKYYC